MRRFLTGIFALIGFITVVLLVILAWSFHRLSSPSLSSLTLDDEVVLTLALGDQYLSEHPQEGGVIALLEGRPLSTHSLVAGLDAAGKDPRVKGILLTLEGSNLKIATVQEIRDAFKAFKAKGKFIYTYADTFGDLSNGTLGYYLASASTKIWMMPIGSFNLTGLMLEIPFGKKALDSFYINPQLGRREEYKGMPESFTESDFTPTYKANLQKVIDSFTTQIVADIANDRGMDVATVRDIMNAAPHLPQKAVSTKMIDEIGYKDQAKEAIEKTVGKKPQYFSLEDYIQTLTPPVTDNQIAIIYAEGMISKGKTRRNPLSEEAIMDATEIAKSIREAAENTAIKALILRIDSGGGSPIGSEMIGREMGRAKTKKPVIVSMSNYAASGGYWIAISGKPGKIVAQPATLTGSIGVYAGKIVTQGFWEHYGVHWGEIHQGDNAPVWSTGQNYSEKGWQKLNDYLDQIYDTFLNKVSKGRNIPLEKVRDLAKGQVWNGEQAKENGLIDALGGLTTALKLAKEEAGLAPDAPVSLIHMPTSKTFIEMLLDRNRTNDEASIFSRYPSLKMILQHLDGLFARPEIEMKVPTTFK